MTAVDMRVKPEQVQAISIHEKTAIPIELETALFATKEKIRLAKRIGMQDLAQREEVEYERLSEKAKFAGRKVCIEELGYTPLSKEEYDLWSQWLPTSYQTTATTRVDNTHSIRAWVQYQFDSIPISVGELIAALKDKGLFEYLEIRTPEQPRSPDPVLFGWLDNQPYLLTRWAESDESLVTIEQIKQGLVVRRKANRHDNWMCVPGLGCVGSIGTAGVLFLGIIACLVTHNAISWAPFQNSCISAVFFAGILYLMDRHGQRIRAQAPYAFNEN